MSYATTIAALIVNGAGWEETLAGEYAAYSQEQRRFVDLMLMREDVPSTEVITAATKTLTAADNGKTFFISRISGMTVTLPTAADGFRVTFIVKTAPTSDCIIQSGTANIVGHIVDSSISAGDTSTAGDTLLSFITTASKVGDIARLISDGTSYFVQGRCSTNGGITLSTV